MKKSLQAVRSKATLSQTIARTILPMNLLSEATAAGALLRCVSMKMDGLSMTSAIVRKRKMIGFGQTTLVEPFLVLLSPLQQQVVGGARRSVAGAEGRTTAFLVLLLSARPMRTKLPNEILVKLRKWRLLDGALKIPLSLPASPLKLLLLMPIQISTPPKPP